MTCSTVNKPSNDLLRLSLPIEIWRAAEKQAMRGASPHFSAGAVLFDRKKNIIAQGCSYNNGHYSCHAEEDTVSRLPKNITEGGEVLIVTVLGTTSSWSFSSRPCAKCATILHKRGIQRIHYASRDSEGIWSVRTELVSDLMDATARQKIVPRHNMYGSKMYLKDIKAEQTIAL